MRGGLPPRCARSVIAEARQARLAASFTRVLPATLRTLALKPVVVRAARQLQREGRSGRSRRVVRHTRFAGARAVRQWP